MKKPLSISILVALLFGMLVTDCFPRRMLCYPVDYLVTNSNMIVVGKIVGIIDLKMSKKPQHPAPPGSKLKLYRAEVEVLYGVKNVSKGGRVSLVYRKFVPGKPDTDSKLTAAQKLVSRRIINGDNLLDLSVSDKPYLMFLKRSEQTNTFSAYTAPSDPVCSVFAFGEQNWFVDLVLGIRFQGLVSSTNFNGGGKLFREFIQHCKELNDKAGSNTEHSAESERAGAPD